MLSGQLCGNPAGLYPPYFMRVHRSYIVNLRKITEISRLRILFNKNTSIPVGDRYKERFTEHISKLSFS